MAGEKRRGAGGRTEADEMMSAALCLSELFKKMAATALPFPGMTKTQVDMCMVLDEVGPLSMSAISARLGVAPEQATRAAHALREMGLVECERSAANRRMVIARLSDKGAASIDEHRRIVDEHIYAYLHALGEDESRRLVEAARTVAEIMFAHDIDDPSRPVRMPAGCPRSRAR